MKINIFCLFSLLFCLMPGSWLLEVSFVSTGPVSDYILLGFCTLLLFILTQNSPSSHLQFDGDILGVHLVLHMLIHNQN